MEKKVDVEREDRDEVVDDPDMDDGGNGGGEEKETSTESDSSEEDDVFNIDDSLSSIDRFKKCATCKQPFLRYVEARRLDETVRAVAYETATDVVLPVLRTLTSDEEWQVRLESVRQLPSIAKILLERGGEEGYKLVTEVLIHQILDRFGDQIQEVRTQTVSTFVELARFVRTSDLGQRVLILIIEFGHDNESEDKRIAAAEILHLLAPIVGPDLARDYVLSEIVSLAQDHAFRVRKAVALHFHSSFDAKLPTEYHTKLLKTYVNLCRDDAWVVRKVCAENIVRIAELASPSIQTKKLIPEMSRLAKDSNDWVRKEVFKAMGKFIAVLPENSVSKELLSLYTGLMLGQPRSGSSNNRKMDVDRLVSEDNGGIAVSCAEAFPDILSKVGVSRWGEMRDLFNKLTRHDHVEVRCIMAGSLARIASTLGPEKAEEKLLKTLDRFLQDEATVRKKVIETLVDLLAALAPECRESYLAVLADVMQPSPSMLLSWRFRMLLAKQLPQLSRLFSPMATFGVVVKIMFALLEDNVADVRLAALDGIPYLLTRIGEIKEHPAMLQNLIERLCAFASATTYAKRLTFVKMCVSIATSSHQTLFTDHFFKCLLRMCVDPVSNVRLAAVNALAKGPAFVWSEPATQKLVRTRLRDPQRDVVQAAARCLNARGMYDEDDEVATLRHYTMVSIRATTYPDLRWWRHLDGRLNGDEKVERFRARNYS